MPGVYGIPVRPLPSGPAAASPWDTGGTGAGSAADPRRYTTYTPFPFSLLAMAFGSAQFYPSSISGMGAGWAKVAGAHLESGAFAISDLWLGWARPKPLNGVLSVVASLNGNGVSVAEFPLGRDLRPYAVTTATHSGTGSLTVGPLTAVGYSLALATISARAGTVVVPSGWTAITTGSVSGTAILAYRLVPAGEVVSLTWDGPTNNSAGCLALLR